MLVQRLSLSLKCLGAIGNSLNLEDMMKEVVRTFVQETYSTYGAYYLIDSNKFSKIVSVGRVKKFDLNDYKDLPQEYTIIKNCADEKSKILIFPLEHGVLYFVYENKNIDLDFVGPMFFNLKQKIDMSINSCLNVELVKQKNINLKEKTLKLEELTLNLQEKIDLAVLENKEKDKQLYEQSKMAQMGELMGNIAHQWRQPLNVISTSASGMQFHHENGLLTADDITDFTNAIMKYSQYLSNIIDAFQQYTRDTKKCKDIIIQNKLNEAIQLVFDSYKKENISIVQGDFEEEDIFINIILGELIEVLLEIFNNCKDAFDSKNIENKLVKYSLYKKENMALITVEDNAGGIPVENIDKIFAPYFTTKHKSQGTGIGLYLSYEIIVNQLGGNLYVENTQVGAKFFIEIPIRK